MTRVRTEAAIAVLVVVVMLAAGAVAILVLSRKPNHESAADVPSATSAAPAARYSTVVDEMQRLARQLAVADNLPGLSVAVAVHGEIVWAEGFGWISDEHHSPITPLTRFRLGALSKPLTAAAAALLHDQGRLDFDAPVQQYVPAYPQKQWPVTTRQLMSDTAGVHRMRGDNNDAMPFTHCRSIADAVEMLHDDPLLFEPGTQYRYSIWGWLLVSAVVDGASGKPFDSFMAHQVFEPLGMDRTLVEESGKPEENAHTLAPYFRLRDRSTRDRTRDDRPDYSCLAGGGAFFSTPTDLVRFGSAMSKPGFLRADTLAAMQTPARLASGASSTYALGWTVGSLQLAGEPARMISHRGSPFGGAASLLAFPDRGLVIAAAANEGAKGLDPFARQVADAFARPATSR